MSERRLYLDAGIGERRGVVSLDGRPERLLIERDGDAACQALEAKSVARVRAIEKGPGLAFLELAEGPDAVLNLTPEAGKLAAGAMIEIEIRAEARAGKVAAAPLLEDRLQAFAREATIQTGAIARSMADGAQDEALETIFPLPGGGSLAIEPTRALTAVDVDLGARAGEEAKRAARAANFAATTGRRCSRPRAWLSRQIIRAWPSARSAGSARWRSPCPAAPGPRSTSCAAKRAR